MTLANGAEHSDETFEGLALDEGDALEEVRLEGCTVAGATLREVSLRRCLFDECTFERCDLTMAKLFDSRLRGVRFVRCKLMGVDFTSAYGLGLEVSFEECVLSYANFLGNKRKVF